MTMLAVLHFILEAEEKILEGIAIKLWLSNHTNDYTNRYLHNKRLLLL